jgi:hypothetical protein
MLAGDAAHDVRRKRPVGRVAPISAAGNALTVVLPVSAGREEALKALLTEIGTHIADNAYFRFSALTSVHFLRWVVVPPESSSSPSLLAFECNYDGTAEDALRELSTVAPTGMNAIYRHCDGARGNGASDAPDVAFLLEHALPYCAFYVGVPGANVQQIKGEQAVRRRIEQYLSDARAGAGPTDARTLYQGAVRLIRADADLSSVVDRADDAQTLRPLRLAAGLFGALAVSPAILPALLAIRAKEFFDDETSQLSISDEAAVLMAREDLQVQNQLTHVVPLRAGPLRAVSTRVVLGVIDFLAREFFTRGSLGGISSIHFARWVLIDEGRRLLFFSNYDGSWESYLGDFIDKAALGLTSIWSNTEEFPKTKFLLFKGARDEERFKAWTRAHQIPTQLWYSAYPDLTVQNILASRKICAELRRGLKKDREIDRWLRRF